MLAWVSSLVNNWISTFTSADPCFCHPAYLALSRSHAFIYIDNNLWRVRFLLMGSPFHFHTWLKTRRLYMGCCLQWLSFKRTDINSCVWITILSWHHLLDHHRKNSPRTDKILWIVIKLKKDPRNSLSAFDELLALAVTAWQVPNFVLDINFCLLLSRTILSRI